MLWGRGTEAWSQNDGCVLKRVPQSLHMDNGESYVLGEF